MPATDATSGGSPVLAAQLCHGIPADAARQLGAMGTRGIHAISFTPSGGWVVVGRPGAGHIGYAARGIPDACFVRLGEFVRAGHAIRCIAFAPAGGWVIVSDRAYFASGIPEPCFRALVDAWADGRRPTCVAFAPSGGWALLAGSCVAGEGLPAACWQRLSNWAQRLRPALQLAFTPAGGWVLLSADRVAHEDLPPACAAHLAQVAQAHQVERVAFSPTGGWAIGSETAGRRGPDDPLCQFEECFRLVNGRWRSLAERMAAQGCAGAGLALAEGTGLRVDACHGALEVAAWRRAIAAWLGGAKRVVAPAGQGVAVDGASLQAFVFAADTNAEAAAALAGEMAEAAARCWPAAAGAIP